MTGRDKAKEKEKDGQEEEETESSSSALDQNAMIAALTKLMDEKFSALRDELKGKKKRDQSNAEEVHDLDQEPVHKFRDPRKKPTDDHANEYYSSRDYSSRGSRRRPRQTKEGPDAMDINLGNYKMRVPQFVGKNDLDAYLDWEKKAELVFTYQKYYGVNCVKIAAAKFYDYALSWWDQTVSARVRSGAFPIETWDEMKRVMRTRFVPSHYHRELHSKLRKLTQGSRSVEDYYQELEVLMIRANIVEDREATMSRFLGGLNREIQDVVEMQHYHELEEMLHKAVLVEQKLKRKGPSRFGSDFRKPNYQRDIKPTLVPKTEIKLSSFLPEKSKARTDGTSSIRARDVKCYKCHGLGHYASECVNRRVMVLKDNGEVESEEEPEMEVVQDTGEYEAKPVCGQLLVARRVLTAQARTDEEGQRENLFHSRCLVKEKVCSLIIDGGSCTNVASETMVRKLDLKPQKHPRA